jgi:hypothetical protein
MFSRCGDIPRELLDEENEIVDRFRFNVVDEAFALSVELKNERSALPFTKRSGDMVYTSVLD